MIGIAITLSNYLLPRNTNMIYYDDISNNENKEEIIETKNMKEIMSETKKLEICIQNEMNKNTSYYNTLDEKKRTYINKLMILIY